MQTQTPRNASLSRLAPARPATPPLLAALAILLAMLSSAGPAAAQIPGALNATLTASPSTPPAGEPVSFTYSARPPAVAPPFPSISSITVNYGDGGSDFGATGSTGQPVSGLLTHVYTAPGAYTATLTAMASNGQSGSATAAVTVASGNATSASWLDSPLSSWNSAGMAIPSAPPVNQSGNDAFCNADFRGPENANDSAITAAGWRLFGVYEGGWGVYIAGGQADEDGMCRPLSFQYFVFVNGTFAGTLSPVLMNSRTDGAAYEVYISPGGGTLQGEFNRYKPSDALCCPSASTEVGYHISYTGDKPVLVPDTANTTPNS